MSYLTNRVRQCFNIMFGYRDKSQMLLDYIAAGDATGVTSLLNAGVDINMAPISGQLYAGRRPLLAAVISNQPEILKLLIDRGADVHFLAKIPKYYFQGTTVPVPGLYNYTSLLSEAIKASAQPNNKQAEILDVLIANGAADNYPEIDPAMLLYAEKKLNINIQNRGSHD